VRLVRAELLYQAGLYWLKLRMKLGLDPLAARRKLNKMEARKARRLR
jgi:hypothetical protein